MGAGRAVLCTLVCTARQTAVMSCAREAGRPGRVGTCSVHALGCVACAAGQAYKGSMYLMRTRARRANKGASGGIARTAKETTCSPLQCASHGALVSAGARAVSRRHQVGTWSGCHSGMRSKEAEEAEEHRRR